MDFNIAVCSWVFCLLSWQTFVFCDAMRYWSFQYHVYWYKSARYVDINQHRKNVSFAYNITENKTYIDFVTSFYANFLKMIDQQIMLIIRYKVFEDIKNTFLQVKITMNFWLVFVSIFFQLIFLLDFNICCRAFW